MTAPTITTTDILYAITKGERGPLTMEDFLTVRANCEDWQLLLPFLADDLFFAAVNELYIAHDGQLIRCFPELTRKLRSYQSQIASLTVQVVALTPAPRPAVPSVPEPTTPPEWLTPAPQPVTVEDAPHVDGSLDDGPTVQAGEPQLYP